MTMTQVEKLSCCYFKINYLKISCMRLPQDLIWLGPFFSHQNLASYNVTTFFLHDNDKEQLSQARM